MVSVRLISISRSTDMHRIKKIDLAISDRKYFSGFERIRPKGSGILLFKAGGPRKEVVFFGDSNVQMYAPRVLKLLKNQSDPDLGVVFVSHGGSAPIPGVKNIFTPESTELVPLLLNTISINKEIKKIVISAYWFGVYGPQSPHEINGIKLKTKEGRDEAIQSLGKLIRSLVSTNIKVTVILGIPNGKELEPKNFYNRTLTGISFKEKPILTKTDFLLRNTYIEELKDIVTNNGGIIIDPIDYLCQDNICITEDEDGPIRYDYAHLRAGYARDKIYYIDEVINP
jgi:hypothetical protein